MVGALVALGTAGQPDSGEGISDLEAAAGRGGGKMPFLLVVRTQPCMIVCEEELIVHC